VRDDFPAPHLDLVDRDPPQDRYAERLQTQDLLGGRLGCLPVLYDPHGEEETGVLDNQ
jgi:hypothetical protein